MEKDVKFTQKKVDESWKDSIQGKSGTSNAEKASSPTPTQSREKRSSDPFIQLMTSLGVQCLMFLGELPPEEGKKPILNLTAAKETIDLLMALEEKTKGNLSKNEETLLNQLTADLQMKFVNHPAD